jgi:hypothetical protein
VASGFVTHINVAFINQPQDRITMSSARLVAFAVVAAVVALSGCGKSATTATTHTQAAAAQAGTETSKPASSTPTSSGELISEANAICRRVAARRASNRAETNEQFARVVSELASFEQGISAELAKLAPPASLASDWRQILTGVQMLAADTAKVGEYARTNQLHTAIGARVVSAREKLENQLLSIARRDGFTDCARTI